MHDGLLAQRAGPLLLAKVLQHLQPGGRLFTKNGLYALLTNVMYVGQMRYKDQVHRGEHQSIVPDEMFRRAPSLLQRNGHTGDGAGDPQ